MFEESLGTTKKKRKKAGGRDWQPGQSGNPLGRSVQSQEVRDAKRYMKEEFDKITFYFHKMNFFEFTAYCHAIKKTMDVTKPFAWPADKWEPPTTLRASAAIGMMTAISKGSLTALAFFLDRTVGRPKFELVLGDEINTGNLDEDQMIGMAKAFLEGKNL